MFASSVAAPAQTKQVSKTVFLDSDGNVISNNEFVDIRMANFHYPDRTLMRSLEDGTVEFRLQKVPQEGAPAPPMGFQTLNGKAFAADDLKGKVLVLNFWFIGCPVCRAEMPDLNQMAAKFAGNDNVRFISMTADPAERVRKFLERERFDYLHVADAETLMKSFVFGGYPKNIVIGKDGRIVYWRSTIKAWWKFESVIRSELAR